MNILINFWIADHFFHLEKNLPGTSWCVLSALVFKRNWSCRGLVQLKYQREGAPRNLSWKSKGSNHHSLADGALHRSQLGNCRNKKAVRELSHQERTNGQAEKAHNFSCPLIFQNSVILVWIFTVLQKSIWRYMQLPLRLSQSGPWHVTDFALSALF